MRYKKPPLEVKLKIGDKVIERDSPWRGNLGTPRKIHTVIRVGKRDALMDTGEKYRVSHEPATATEVADAKLAIATMEREALEKYRLRDEAEAKRKADPRTPFIDRLQWACQDRELMEKLSLEELQTIGSIMRNKGVLS